MFGYHRAKRKKKKLKREMEDLKKQNEAYYAQKPELEKQKEAEQKQAEKEYVQSESQQAKEDRKQARQEGREYAEELLNRDIQGLTPEQRKIMQYEASHQIKRAQQSANRNLLGNQSTHGISPKSGVAYYQQRDLQKMANEAQGQAHRDVEKLNADLALKKLAAMFNIEQGEASQSQLDKQLALDELRLQEERRKQKYWEDKFNNAFSRV